MGIHVFKCSSSFIVAELGSEAVLVLTRRGQNLRQREYVKILPTEELEFCFRWNTGFIVKQSRKQKLTSGLIGRLGQIFKCLLFGPKVDFVFWEGFLLFFRKSVSCSVFTQRR